MVRSLLKHMHLGAPGKGTFAHMLLRVKDPATGQPLSNARMLPEIAALFFAGIDTTGGRPAPQLDSWGALACSAWAAVAAEGHHAVLCWHPRRRWAAPAADKVAVGGVRSSVPIKSTGVEAYLEQGHLRNGLLSCTGLGEILPCVTQVQ